MALLAWAALLGTVEGASLMAEGDTAEINGAHFTMKTGFHTTNTFLDVGGGGGQVGVFGGHNTGGATVNDENPGTTDVTLGEIPIVQLEGSWFLQILVDLNEAGSNKENVDFSELQVFTHVLGGQVYNDGGNGAIIDPHEAGSNLLGILRYDLDALADETLSAEQFAVGSNAVDLEILLPVSMFAGLDASTYAYLYAEFSEGDGGPERWVFDEDNPMRITDIPVPEPNSALLLGCSTLALVMRRRRPRNR